MLTTSEAVGNGDLFELGALGEKRLPVLLSARRSGVRIAEVTEQLVALGQRHLLEAGGVLYRGFDVPNIEAFRSFAAAFGSPLLGYDFGSTPRSKLREGVYTSTEYPAHQHIPLHNEQAYCRRWPMKIWFHCAIAARRGGETPICDSREVYRRMPGKVLDRLVERGLMYVRNFGGGLDLPWQEVFDTEHRGEVEVYCQQQGIDCEWKDDGELRTRQVCQVVALHPKTLEPCWFNQAHLFHVSGLEPEVRAALLDAVEPEDLPRNVYYANGSPIEDGLLDEVRGVLDQLKVAFPWQSGDILMLDNMLTAHARTPFEGPRQVVVAMAEPNSSAPGEGV
jgi:alpha-ketoglutarate-dependent taurine dioxygenase